MRLHSESMCITALCLPQAGTDPRVKEGPYVRGVGLGSAKGDSRQVFLQIHNSFPKSFCAGESLTAAPPQIQPATPLSISHSLPLPLVRECNDFPFSVTNSHVRRVCVCVCACVYVCVCVFPPTPSLPLEQLSAGNCDSGIRKQMSEECVHELLV